ncbi:DNA-binding protein [Flaviflexus ciconiae]|uniref:DNA-binding protein n=1 Tax=Flaviflexus ciconiae TaxID=2496867 RepID=A0A3S9PXZ4_9ACTO|nr:helix-turn-helix domain-containing protein [Flaviflexus ciconiae]AZQ77270.1 DNA-binding protein [Flaviflexus ciconiae]
MSAQSVIEPKSPAYTSVKGAATLLDCHPDTIRHMIYAGELPHVRIRKAIRIPLTALTVEALAGGVQR